MTVVKKDMVGQLLNLQKVQIKDKLKTKQKKEYGEKIKLY